MKPPYTRAIVLFKVTELRGDSEHRHDRSNKLLNHQNDMRTFILIAALSFIPFLLPAQEIGLSGSYAAGTFHKFAHTFGFGLEYNEYMNPRQRLGVSLSMGFCNAQYDDIQHSLAYGTALYIDQVTPRNKRFALRVNYAFGLLRHPKSNLLLGPEVGLNCFWIHEQIDRTANGIIPGGHYSSVSSNLYRFGLGFLLEYELREVIGKGISTFMAINPEITGFAKSGMKGTNSPAAVGWLNVELGFRYCFHKKGQK